MSDIDITLRGAYETLIQTGPVTVERMREVHPEISEGLISNAHPADAE